MAALRGALEVRFTSPAHLQRVIRLVKLAIEQIQC
jgi:hypothetical protein